MCDLDSGDPICPLLGGQTPPFAANRRFDAASVCDYRLSE